MNIDYESLGYNLVHQEPLIWMRNGFFYIQRKDGTLLSGHQFENIKSAIDGSIFLDYLEEKVINEKTSSFVKETTVLEEIDEFIKNEYNIIGEILGDVCGLLKKIGTNPWSYVPDTPMFVGLADRVIGPQQDITARVTDNSISSIKSKNELQFIANSKINITILSLIIVKLLKVMMDNNIKITDDKDFMFSIVSEYKKMLEEQFKRREKYENYRKNF